MGLGQPTYSLKVPSLYDGLELSCRIYHPSTSTSRRDRCDDGINAALVGHPYAPMGGSYDDHIVNLVGEVLVKDGYVVATLNFRGTHGSQGNSSWQGKAELADYLSAYGFMLCYMSCIQGRKDDIHSISESLEPPSINVSQHPSAAVQGPAGGFVCAGYSYGTLMARYAPTSETVVNLFTKAAATSVQEEIFLRAAHLAKLHCESLRERSQSRSRSPQSTHSHTPVSIGGLESTGASLTSGSRQGRVSLDIEKVRRSIDRFRNRGDRVVTTKETGDGEKIDRVRFLKALPAMKTSYLLVSPPIGLGASLATAFSTLSIESKIGSFDGISIDVCDTVAQRLSTNDSLAIWGEADIIQSSHSLRKWAEGLAREANSRFTSAEVPAAGHFWREPGVTLAMRQAIDKWLRSLH